ncbi:MAG TPA: aminopeptidase, partial [bacterium]|nr:aminopeptidase [bacterium]
MLKTNAWKLWKQEEKEKAFSFSEEYKKFISENKTERKFVNKSVELAKKTGFKDITAMEKIVPGDSIFKINKNKQVIFGKIGEVPIEEGARFIVAHIDAPRLDLKPNPVYEDEGIVFFKTHYYGGIKKYHWLTIPLALYGTVVSKTGEIKMIEIGDKTDDPVFTITDLLPHLSRDQVKKTIEEGFPGENLNIVAATIPMEDDKEPVKKNLFSILGQYGVNEEDLISSEFEVVP